MSLARNLGRFFGHIAKAVASDPTAAPAQREVARREMTATTIVQTAEGPRAVVLRRTVIDEVAAGETLEVQSHAPQAGQQSPLPRENSHGASDSARDAGEPTKFPR